MVLEVKRTSRTLPGENEPALVGEELINEQDIAGFEEDLDEDLDEELEEELEETARELQASVPMNLYESDDQYRVELLVPGFNRDDFTIELDDDGILTVSAEAEEEIADEDEEIRRQEFSYRSFSRSISIPDNALDGQIDASYENGVLTLLIPKEETGV